MKNDIQAPVQGFSQGEPYIGMPIYLDDYDEYECDDRKMPEIPEELPEEKNESDGNYCRDSAFENWPLAMAYVPWQRFKEVYEAEVGFEMGTIFPELNLPFLGGGGK